MSSVPVKACSSFLYVNKQDQADFCKRFRANLKVTWNHLLYFLTHGKVETPRTLAEHLIAHLTQLNNNSSLSFDQNKLDQLQNIFDKVHCHIRNAQASAQKQREFNAQAVKYQSKKPTPSASHKPSAEQTPTPPQPPPPPPPTPPADLSAFHALNLLPTQPQALILDSDIAKWNLKLRNAQVKGKARRVVLPEYDFKIDAGRVRSILALPAGTHIYTRGNPRHYFRNLNSSEKLQFYRMAMPITKNQILMEYWKEEAPKNIFSLLNDQDLRVAAQIVFKNVGVTLDNLGKLIALGRDGNTYQQRLAKIETIFGTLADLGHDPDLF